VRIILKIPAPKTYVWSSRATKNAVGAEYIIMEKVAGVPLSQKWNKMTADDKESLIEEVVNFESAFASAKFSAIGRLYYEHDLKPGEYVKQNISSGESGEFSVGPSTDRKTFDDGRGAVAFDRGPCIYIYSFLVSSA
jgi:hypothetical protein